MATNGASPFPFSPPLSKNQERFFSLLFVLFLYFCFVGLLPFGPRTAYVLEETGKGDFLQQLYFTGIAAAFALFSLLRHPGTVIRTIGPWVGLAMGWMILSALWSQTPEIALRRAAFTVIVVSTVYMAIITLGPEKIFRLLFYTLLVAILASLVSGLTVPAALHRPGMRGAEDLVGLWRGVFMHKNEAGSAAAFLFLLAFQQLVYGPFIKSKLHIGLALISAPVMLFLAFSKTAILLIPPTLFLAAVFHFFITRKDANHRVLLTLLILFGLPILTLALGYTGGLGFLDNPEALTGRTKIWQTLVAMIAEKPLTGFGYGSIFEVGSQTPLLTYASGWATRVAHGHNGYLKVTVELGMIGLFLVITGFILLPFARTVFSRSIPPSLLGPILAIFIFFILYNTVESPLLDRKAAQWVIFLIGVASVQQTARTKKIMDQPRTEQENPKPCDTHGAKE